MCPIFRPMFVWPLEWDKRWARRLVQTKHSWWFCPFCAGPLSHPEMWDLFVCLTWGNCSNRTDSVPNSCVEMQLSFLCTLCSQLIWTEPLIASRRDETATRCPCCPRSLPKWNWMLAIFPRWSLRSGCSSFRSNTNWSFLLNFSIWNSESSARPWWCAICRVYHSCPCGSQAIF